MQKNFYVRRKNLGISFQKKASLKKKLRKKLTNASLWISITFLPQSGGLVSPKGVVEGCGRETLKSLLVWHSVLFRVVFQCVVLPLLDNSIGAQKCLKKIIPWLTNRVVVQKEGLINCLFIFHFKNHTLVGT